MGICWELAGGDDERLEVVLEREGLVTAFWEMMGRRRDILRLEE